MPIARIPRVSSPQPRSKPRRRTKTLKPLIIPPMPQGPTKGLLTRLEQIDINQEVFLPPKEEKFARLYIKQLNATQCYIMAGMMASGNRNAARVLASKLLTKANIQVRLAQLWDKERQSSEMSPNGIVQMYVKAATSRMADFFDDDGTGVPKLKNLNDMPSELLEGLETGYDANGQPKVKARMVSKSRVYEMLGKVHKLFGDIPFVQNNLTQKVQVFNIGGSKFEF